MLPSTEVKHTYTCVNKYSHTLLSHILSCSVTFFLSKYLLHCYLSPLTAIFVQKGGWES